METGGQNRSADRCCDVCCPSAFDVPHNERLSMFEATTVSSHKRRRAMRVVDQEDLRAKLITVRDESFREKSDFCMIGLSLYCAD